MALSKVIEVQCVDAGDAGSNADVLNPDRDENEEQQIGSTAAKMRVPTEVFGAQRLAPKRMAKCPTNMRFL